MPLHRSLVTSASQLEDQRPEISEAFANQIIQKPLNGYLRNIILHSSTTMQRLSNIGTETREIKATLNEDADALLRLFQG
jgi:hypothetical protein